MKKISRFNIIITDAVSSGYYDSSQPSFKTDFKAYADCYDTYEEALFDFEVCISARDNIHRNLQVVTYAIYDNYMNTVLKITHINPSWEFLSEMMGLTEVSA